MKTTAFLFILSFINVLYGQNNVSDFEILQELIQSDAQNRSKLESRWINEYRDYYGAKGNLPTKKEWIDIQKKIKEVNFNSSSRVQTSWYPLGPESKGMFITDDYPRNLGRVNALAIHPNNQNCLFVGTPNGGLWKTTNLGESWMPIEFNGLEGVRTQSISAIEIDPENPDVIYVGTGDYDGLYKLVANLTRYMEFRDGRVGSHGLVFGAGVLKSLDGGNSWQMIGPNPLDSPYSNFGAIKKISINPDDSNHLVIGGTDGLFESFDAGNTWDQLIEYPILDFVQSPVNFRSVWASIYDYDSERTKLLYCPNIESGNELCFSEQNPTFGDDHSRRIEIAISKTSPNLIMAVNVDRNSKFLGVYKTVNGGINWEKILGPDELNVLSSDSLGLTDNSQGLYDLALAIDPSDENNIYIGGINIWASFDSGQTWQLNAFKDNTNTKKGVHADQHFFKFSNEGDRLFVCNDGGVYYTDDILAEAEYHDITDGLAITQFYRVATYGFNSEYLIAGAQDNSTFYKTPEGWYHIFHSDGMDCFISLISPKAITGGSQGGRMWRSFDGGHNYIAQDGTLYPAGEEGFFVAEFTRGILKEGAHWISPFHYDDFNNNIYAGFVDIFKYSNGSWTQFSNFSESDSLKGPHYRIKQSKYNRSHFVSIKHPDKPTINYQQVTVPSRIHLTKDDGETWVDISHKLPIADAPFPSDAEYGNNSSTMFVSFGGVSDEHKIYRSNDGGESWVNYSKDLPPISINCIAHHYESALNNIYLGTDIGVFFSNDEMNNWEYINEGFPTVRVTDLDINYFDNKLTASTYGRGLWQAELIETDLVSTSVNDYDSFKQLIEVGIFPNVNNGSFVLELKEGVELSEEFNLSIIDISGRIVHKDVLELISDNPIEFSLDLLPGQYYIHAFNGSNYFVKKFLVQ